MAAKVNVQESQAVWSVILAAVAGLSFLAAAGMILPAFRWEHFEIVMRAGGTRFFAILGAIGVAGGASFIGAIIAFNSAGHRRNKKSGLSWTGFFVNAGIMTITLCLFVVFWLAKEPISGQ